MGIDESRSLHQNRSSKAERRKGFRNLLCENLERREVMAGSILDADFRLLSVAPNTGEILSTTRSNILNESPRELIFRFAGGDDVQQSTLRNGIRITRSGGDGVFGAGGLATDIVVSPDYLDFADPTNRRVVVARFAQPLPDDLYSVEILGADNASVALIDTGNLVRRIAHGYSNGMQVGFSAIANTTGLGPGSYYVINATADDFQVSLTNGGPAVNLVGNGSALLRQVNAIRNAPNGEELTPRKAGTNRDTYNFNLELGTKITAIVPQPLIRAVNGTLSQAVDTIDVYFNDSELYDTKITTGDLAPDPSVVDPRYYNLIATNDSVSPFDDRVFNPQTVTFDPATKMATLKFSSSIGALAGSGTYRLRIGSAGLLSSVTNPVPVPLITPPSDPEGFLSDAFEMNAGVAVTGNFSRIFEQEIRTVSNPLQLDFPGSSQEPGHRDIQEDRSLRTPAAIWGEPDFRPDPDTQIRTIKYNFMEGQAYGVASDGRRLFTSISSEQKQRVREVFEFYSRYLGVDFQEYSGPTVPGIFNVVVGDMIPIRETISGPGDLLGAAGQVPNPDNPLESWDMVILDNSEAWDNAFGFGVSQKPLGAEAVPDLPTAQQGPFSFFNTAMHEIGHLLGLDHTYDLPAGTIMGSDNNGGTTNSTGGIVGTRLNSPANPLEQIFPGTIDQIHGQHAHRPDNRDVDLYRFELIQQGQVRLETIAERLNDSSNLDTHLTLLKRDTATGALSIVAVNNNYISQDSLIEVTLGVGEYFVAITGKGNEDNNPQLLDTGSGATSQGRYQLRFDFKSTNSDIMTEQSFTSTARGSALDGDGDGIAGGDFNFWFRATDAYGTTAASPRTLIVDKAYTGLTAVGTLAQPFKSISAAVSAAQPGDIIRLAGVQESVISPETVKAYEVGIGAFGSTLSDGDRLEVPRGVTLMIDAGAILKMGNSRILVGSDGIIDRSGAAIQVLGTPTLPVFFTSYTDESLGIDTNDLITTPKAGDWGGVEIRNDVDRSQGRFDREREGIFLNTISNAWMTYGGGLVGFGAQAKVTSPIELGEARPLILGNRISQSADAAISADPNSFEETLFTEPRYQHDAAFVPDYRRVGPVVYSNTVIDNTINGMFVRVQTLPGQPLKTLTTHARIDDSEITLVFGENLVIAGTPGGPLNEASGPNVALMILSVAPTGSGFTNASALEYIVTYTDRFGQESLPSASMSIVVPANRSVQLSNIPVATGDYVSRKIYRRVNAAGPYQLAGVLNKDDTVFVDNNITLRGAIQTLGLPELNRSRQDGTLVIDPGIVAKLFGTRIEVGLGATLIAEGTEAKPVVFTSRRDDRYGAGGTFDTNNDSSNSVGAAGDWSGILARHMSELSIDRSIITFAGGESRIPGGFASFNPIEIHQGTARIANSLIENNASGRTNTGGTNRDARGNNDAAAIFVLSSQPVIINNIIRSNTVSNTAAISVDHSSLNAKAVRDFGRATGLNQREENLGIGNYGPLVFNNRLGNNALNGMRVRGGTLTSESIWDDTDIVHILQSEIIVPDFHTFGGLRLVSKVDSSLVVKAQNDTANPSVGITAAGRPLDIKDRIGGTVQILGSPGFPVVITSLADDKIGAGFDDKGASLRDTNNDGGASDPDNDPQNRFRWRSVRFTPFSNDRNVDMNYEKESDQIAGSGDNDLPSKAQDIGKLAGDLKLGDENLRLGITLTGSIGTPKDLDVYRFSGVAGSTVWLDIDQTSGSLDSIVELIDASGQIMALSDDSFAEAVGEVELGNPNYPIPIRAYPMDQLATGRVNSLAPSANIDFQGTNPRDAGMRVILPGVVGSTNVYFARVRSSNKIPGVVTNPYDTTGGMSVGAYKLHLRLQEKQEIAGSTVRFADLRYAVNGIEIYGNPMHSPLLGEFAELSTDIGNETPASALNIGNIMVNDRAGVSISGSLSQVPLPSATDVDWFNFEVGRDEDSIQKLPQTTSNSPLRIDAHQSLIFDLDYADGLGRANTQLWIFERNPVTNQLTLVLTADDSNIQDDQPAILKGSDYGDITRGSMGKRDAYIGPIEMPPGLYTVAITSKALSAVGLLQFTQADLTGVLPAQNVRLEPLDSVARLGEDRFELPPPRTTASGAPVVFYQSRFDQGQVPFTLADVTLFASRGNSMSLANAMTGTVEANMSRDGTNPLTYQNGRSARDIAVSPAGTAMGFQNLFQTNPVTGFDTPILPITDTNSGVFFGIDIGDTGTTIPGETASGIVTWGGYVDADGNLDVRPSADAGAGTGDGMVFTALTYTSVGATSRANFFGVASRRGNGTFNEFPNIQPGRLRNIVYQLNPDSGAAINWLGLPTRSEADYENGVYSFAGTAMTNIQEAGYFTVGAAGAAGTVNGVTTVGQQMYGVSDRGELVTPAIVNGPPGGPTRIATILDPTTGAAVNFTGLTRGPANLEGGRFADMLFGVSTAGVLYAFDTTGVLQPIFPFGRTSVQLGFAPVGIDFSSLDANLWHVSSTDPDSSQATGHGRAPTFNSSGDSQTTGNNTIRFAVPSTFGNSNTFGTDSFGQLTNTFAMPGGAKGAFESVLLDLSSYSADDQPVMYFNYNLRTQNNAANTDGNIFGDGDDNPFLDSFRVYGAGEDGQWILLTTNNSEGHIDTNYAEGVPFPPFSEYDVPRNGNQDAFGRSYISSSAFDNQGWRQARVNLGSLAGKRDVKIRFEFHSGGDFQTNNPLIGGLEITAIPGNRILQEATSTFEIQSPTGVVTFEFDQGLVLNVPSGASFVDGEQLNINSDVFSFRSTPVGLSAKEIPFASNDTPSMVATSIANVLRAKGYLVRKASSSASNVLNITHLNGLRLPNAATPGTNYSFSADPTNLRDIITFKPGVEIPNVPVYIDHYMPAVPGTISALETSFADQVDDYSPLGVVDSRLQNRFTAIGRPDWAKGSAEPSGNDGVVSLGLGGSMILRFTDNFLVLGLSPDPDLAVYEVGSAEEVQVEVSRDGVTYELVGTISSVSPNIDLDDPAFGFSPLDRFQFVRLTDLATPGGNGADIDAVQALSSSALHFAELAPSYNPGTTLPDPALRNPIAALGQRDYLDATEPLASDGNRVVSLGDRGSIVVQFDKVYLTGSGTPAPDLAVYEVGTSESVQVEVSLDGINFTSVGTISGANPSVDLDQFGFNAESLLQYVRLTDAAGGPLGTAAGADIDAVQALSTRQQNVRDELRIAFAAGLNVAGQEDNIDVWRYFRDTVKIFGAGMDVLDQGVLRYSPGGRVGDVFGPQDTINPLFQAARRTLLNGTENGTRITNGMAITIDDIVISFAERGEIVTGPAFDGNQFGPTFRYELFGGPNGAAAQESETGPYDLEIRTAPDYGRSTAGGDLVIAPVPAGPNGRTFDTNERLVKGMALNTTGLSRRIADGHYFTLSNGVNVVTFEFNVSTDTTSSDPANSLGQAGRFIIDLSPDATDGQIALAIRNAVNASAVRALLGVTAQINGDMFGTPLFNDSLGNNIQFNGNIASDLFGGADFTMFDSLDHPTTVALTVIKYGQDTQWGEDLGDSNILRDQGQLIISGAIVLNSQQYGINLIPAPRDLSNRFINMDLIPPPVGQDPRKPISTETIDRSYPGSVRNTITLNTSRIASGPVLVNNILAKNTSGGIRVGGDTVGPANREPEAPVTVARIVNNTIYGRGTGTGQVGIEVEANTSPTILSNAIANLGTGINLANNTALRNSVVIGANIYQGVSTNVFGAVPGNPESFPITSPQELFVNAPRDIYYLRPGVQAIDSSLASLEDRSLLSLVRDGIELPKESPIIAPEFDAYGLLRSDDPTVSTPAGLGGTVFADRGALDRVDLNGPLALIQRPSDNDAAGNDRDGFNTYIRMKSGNIDYFEFLIDERQGTGPDPLTINQDNVVLTENGRMLRPGVDYIFGYSFNNRTIRLTPLAGFWRQDSVYEVTLMNKLTRRIEAPGDAANRSDGSVLTATLSSGATQVLELDSGYTLVVPASGGAGIVDGEGFTYFGGAANEVQQLSVTGTPRSGSFTLQFSDGLTTASTGAIPWNVTAAGLRTILEALPNIGSGNVSVVGGPLQAAPLTVTFQGALARANFPAMVTNDSLIVGGGVSLATIANGAAGKTTQFEFNVATDTVTGLNRQVIAYNVSDTADVLAAKIAAAVNPFIRQQWPAQAIGGGSVVVGGNAGDSLTLFGPNPSTPSSLTRTGTLGVQAGAIPVRFLPTAQFDAIAMANQITKALNQIGSGVRAYTLANGLIFAEGITTIRDGSSSTAPSLTSLQLDPVTDLAGNNLQANRPNALTQFTVLMPEVSVDYGDAMERPSTGSTSNTLLADNGVRHALYPEDAMLLTLGAYADGDPDGQPSNAADGDDFDSAIDFGSLANSLAMSPNGPARLLVSANDPAIIGKSITIKDPLAKTVTYEFTNGGVPSIPGARPVDVSGAVTASDVASRLQAVVLASILDGSITGIHAFADGAVLSLGGSRDHSFDLTNASDSLFTAVSRYPSGANEISVTSLATLTAGQTMFLTDGVGNTVGFQVIDTNPLAPIVLLGAGNVAVSVDLTLVTRASFAAALADAINKAISDSKLKLPTVSVEIKGSGASQTVLVTGTADDEDGFSYSRWFNKDALPTPITLTASASGLVDAWIDWNQDNDFNDAGERLLTREPVVAGTNTFYILPPATAKEGFTTARFRLSSTGGLFTNGMGIGGEVEDHVIEILPGSPPVGFNDGTFNNGTPDPLYTVAEEGTLTRGDKTAASPQGVLLNDIDPDGDTLFVDNFDRTIAIDPLDPTLVQPVRRPQYAKTFKLYANGSFVYEPLQDFYGTDSFIYDVTDGRMTGDTSVTVTITVTPVNDEPVGVAETVEIFEDSGVTTPALPRDTIWNGSIFTGNDLLQPDRVPGPNNDFFDKNESRDGQSLRITGIALADLNYRPFGEDVQLDLATQRVTYTPPKDYNNLIAGPRFLVITIEDDGVHNSFPNVIAVPKQATYTVTINILDVNDRPDFDIPNKTQTPLEDAGLVTVNNFVTAIRPSERFGAAPGQYPARDERGESDLPPPLPTAQNVFFDIKLVDPSHASLFVTPPAIDASGTLTYLLAPDVNRFFAVNPGFPREIRVEVVGQDDGPTRTGRPDLNRSIPQTFTIVPTEVNDPPIISVVSLIQHDEDREDQVLPSRIITSFQAGPATALDELGLIPGKPGQTPEYFYSFLNPLDPNDDPTDPDHDPDYANKMADLFDVQPSIAVDGRLTYDLKPHVNTFLLPGDAIVLRVWAQDRDATDPLFNSQRSAFHNLTIRVNDINDAPEFSIPNTSITVLEDNESVTGVTPTVFVDFAIGVRPGPVIDPDRVDDEKLQTPLAFQVELVSSSTPLNGLPTITHVANTDKATLSFATAPDRNGTATFRTRLRDSRFGNPAFPGIGESQWVTFAINVQPVNDAPQFSLSKTREVSEEDKGLIEVRDFATGISPGPANESTQAPDLEFVLRFVNPDNPNDLTYADRAAALFDVQPTISSDGILRYRAKKDVNTGAFSSLGRDPLVEVLLTDKGPSTFPNQNNSKQTFTLSITPVNDSPTPRRNYNIDIDEDTRVTILPTDITLQPNPDPDGTRATPGPEDEVREGQVLRVTNVNQNTEAGGTFVPTIDPLTTQITGWTYTPPLNFVGQDLITYIISDSGSPNASAAGTITVTISPVNDPPEFSINTNTGNPTMDSAGNITVNEDAAPYSIQWARNIVVGPPSARDEINGIPPSVPPQSMLPFDVRVVNTKAVGMFSSLPAIDKNGVLTFTLATDANGLDPFEDAIVEVIAVDNGRAPNPNDPNDRNRNKSVPVTFTIKVNPVNDAPYFEIRKANVVTAEKPAGSSTPVVEPDVLRNIFPAFGLTESPQRARDEATQTVSFTTTKIEYLDNPSLFTVAPTVSSNGTLTFTPRPNQNGRAIVFVRAVDSGAMTPPNINTSAEQSFTITISPVNDKPVAVDDPASNLQYSTTERFAVPNSTVLNITDPSKGLLINDFDLDGNSFEVDTGILSTYTVNTAKGGTVTVNKNGTFTYNPTPNPGSELRRLFEGATTTDTFTYRIKDGSPDGLLSDPATVFITVIGSNDAPEAKPDQFTIPVNTPTLLNVLVNANPQLSDDPIDNPIDVRTVVIGSLPDPAKGTAEPQPDGRILYTPKPGFRGVDTFTYRVADVSGKVSNEATVTVRVNTAPVAVDDPAVVEMNLDGRVPVATIIDVLENDYDPDLGGSIVQSTLEIVAPSVNGTATVVVDPQNPQKRMIEFIPQTGFEGVTTLEYVVSDNDGTQSNRGMVTIRVIKSFFQNIDNKFDVNDDGFVSPIDVLLVINLLNGVGAPPGWQGTTAGLPGPPDYVDVDGDRFITPLDVIQVINAINNPGNGGAGEGESGAQNRIAPSDLIWSLDAVRLTVENEPNRSYPYERACAALEYGPQPLGSAHRSASNLSLANYLVSLSDEDEEESIEQTLSLEHLARSRDAVDDAFADLFGE